MNKKLILGLLLGFSSAMVSADDLDIMKKMESDFVIDGYTRSDYNKVININKYIKITPNYSYNLNDVKDEKVKKALMDFNNGAVQSCIDFVLGMYLYQLRDVNIMRQELVAKEERVDGKSIYGFKTYVYDNGGMKWWCSSGMRDGKNIKFIGATNVGNDFWENYKKGVKEKIE